MAIIKPFKGLRYQEKRSGALHEVVCPPYDIISKEQREELVKKNPYNMVRLELPQGEDKYAQAAKTLLEWQKKGILKTEDKDSIYIYEEEFTVKGVTKKIKGFICLVRLEEFSKGVVLPHEETLSKAKQDRFDLMSTTFCNFSQIYSLYLDEEKAAGKIIDACSSKTPSIEFAGDDGIIQRLWIVEDPSAIAALTKAFAAKQLFIADGHHRYETALNFRNKLLADGVIADTEHPAGYVMMMLVDMDHEGLVVFPTHRLIKDLPGFDVEGLLKKAEQYFMIEKKRGTGEIEETLLGRADQNAVAFYTGGGSYYLMALKDKGAVRTALPEKSDAYCGLDVTVLHTLILEGGLGIDKENMAKQINLSYTREIDEALTGVDSGKYQCCFILNPTRVGQIKDVALVGEKMPQKSTYFYPKIITGLVISQLMELPE